jgi:rubrerythrin
VSGCREWSGGDAATGVNLTGASVARHAPGLTDAELDTAIEAAAEGRLDDVARALESTFPRRTCLRCGHTWRKPGAAGRCPACHRSRWWLS